jgi:hypothetical protein
VVTRWAAVGGGAIWRAVEVAYGVIAIIGAEWRCDGSVVEMVVGGKMAVRVGLQWRRAAWRRRGWCGSL